MTTINHIGIVVHDIEKAIEQYKMYFDIEDIKLSIIEENNIKIAYLSFENIDIELIQPTSQDSQYYNFLQERGGLHHISVEVSNLSDTVETLKENKMKLESDRPKLGGKGSMIIFSEEESFEGGVIEFKQKE